MKLVPRPSTYIGLTVGGAVIALIGFASARAVGGLAAIVPGVIGGLGVFWIASGAWVLGRRDELAIVIGEDGIEMPSASITRPSSPRFLIPRGDIAMIARSESMRGRGVEVVLKDGRKGFIQVRQYCEIEDFLTHCRKHFPTHAAPATEGHSPRDGRNTPA
jgi:hypothetical protein